jgi:hypothetical protein
VRVARSQYIGRTVGQRNCVRLFTEITVARGDDHEPPEPHCFDGTRRGTDVARMTRCNQHEADTFEGA